MPQTEIDLKPIDFITIGTIGPKGRRVFHLQAGKDGRLVSFIIEKEQARALSEAVREFLDDLDDRYDEKTDIELAAYDMDLREPITPLFRISQMGLGYEEATRMVILIAQELQLSQDDGDDNTMLGVLPDSPMDDGNDEDEPGVVRMWCTREQMLALCLHASYTVSAGRPSPQQNGRITYYWT